MFFAIGFLLIAAGTATSEEDCSMQEFGACVQDVMGIEGEFNVVSEVDMKEVCNSKRQALECASNFVQNCMKKGTRDLYEATTGGKMKVVEDMCTEGTKINRGYVQNLECFEKIQDQVQFCNEKLKESQEALNKATNMLDRLKVFYGCCVFGWHRNCLVKAARTKCDDQAADFIHYVSSIRLGQAQNMICSSSYSSCHGLYGVDTLEEEEGEVDVEEQEDSAAAPSLCADALTVFFLFFLLLTKLSFYFRQNLISTFLPID